MSSPHSHSEAIPDASTPVMERLRCFFTWPANRCMRRTEKVSLDDQDWAPSVPTKASRCWGFRRPRLTQEKPTPTKDGGRQVSLFPSEEGDAHARGDRVRFSSESRSDTCKKLNRLEGEGSNTLPVSRKSNVTVHTPPSENCDSDSQKWLQHLSSLHAVLDDDLHDPSISRRGHRSALTEADYSYIKKTVKLSQSALLCIINSLYRCHVFFLDTRFFR
jgi:hypothetical protein